MGRHTLRIIMVLGVLVTLVGGTGIFAVFSDRATTGENSVTSGERSRAADLKIIQAAEVTGTVTCDPDSDGLRDELDDLPFGVISGTGAQPGTSYFSYVCLRNAGSASLTVTASAIDLTDTEDGCTGDEEAAGDTTCTAGEIGGGELSPMLTATVERLLTCGDSSTPQAAMAPVSLDQYAGQLISDPVIGGDPVLAPDELICVRIVVAYPSTVTETQAQQAQTDSVRWRFAFDGTAS